MRDVTKVAMSYPAEQLTNMWDYKSDIMEKVVGAAGGNDYESHRSLMSMCVRWCDRVIAMHMGARERPTLQYCRCINMFDPESLQHVLQHVSNRAAPQLSKNTKRYRCSSTLL